MLACRRKGCRVCLLAGMSTERETMKARMSVVQSSSEHSMERLGQAVRLSRLAWELLLRRMCCCLRLGVSAWLPESKKVAITGPLHTLGGLCIAMLALCNVDTVIPCRLQWTGGTHCFVEAVEALCALGLPDV